MRLKFILLTFLFVFAGNNWSQAKEVIVKEVRLSLFNKPVTGYKFVLDKSSKLVSNQIIKHVSESAGKPFQFEKTLIFENVQYAPITRQKEISLYFLMNTLPGNITEVTMVAMYDYKSSINTREYPDLALKLLYDLASIINQISGDKLLFEGMILDGSNFEQIAEATRERREQEKEGQLVEHFKEEEVEHSEVRIKQDPFDKTAAPADPENTILSSLNQKIDELANKEKQLEKREKAMEQQVEQVKSLEVKVAELSLEKQRLRDSLTVARDRLEASVALDMAGDEVSVSAIDQKRVDELQQSLAAQKQEAISQKVKADSLQRMTSQLDRSITRITTEKVKLEADIRETRSENALLKADYLIMKSRLATGGPIPESGYTSEKPDAELVNENLALKDEIEQLNKQLSAKDQELVSAKALSVGTFAGRDTTYAKINALRDSLNMLRTGLASASEGNQNQASLESELEQNKMELQAQRSTIEGLNSKNKNLEAEYENAVAINKELESKLKISLEALKNVQSSSGGMLDKMDTYNANLDNLKKDLVKVQEELDKNQTLVASVRDTLISTKSENARIRKELKETRSSKSQTDTEIKELRAQLQKRNEERQLLDKKVNRLTSKSDSLTAALNRPLTELEKNNRDQRARLDKIAFDLEVWKKDLSDREKLISQRELTVDDRLARAESLEKKYQDITSRENKLKALEQKVKQMGGEVEQNKPAVSTPSSPISGNEFGESMIKGGFSPGIAMEIGSEVPVFSFVSSLTYKKTQQQIVAFMVKNGQLYDDKYPNLVYSDALIPLIGTDRMDMRYRLEARGTGTSVRVSVKLENGQYIELDDNNQISLKIKEFLSDMFRFRF